MADFDPGNLAKYGDITRAQLIALSMGALIAGTPTEPASGQNKYDTGSYHYGHQTISSLIALSQGGVLAAPVIDDPSQIFGAKLIAAWDYELATVGTPTTVPPAWNTNKTLTLVGSPEVIAGIGVDGGKLLKINIAGQKATHEAINVANSSLFRVFAPTDNAGVDVTVSGSAGGYIRKDKNGTQAYRIGSKINAGSASTTAIAEFNFLRRGQVALEIITISGSDLIIDTYVSDEAPTTITRVNAGATFTADTLYFDGTTSSKSDEKAFGYINAIMTSEEKAKLALFFANNINKATYVDPLNGNDTNAGYSSGTARKTLASANTVLSAGTGLTAIYDIKTAPNTTFAEGEAFTFSQGGRANRYRRIEPWGVGWTDANGNGVWSTTWTNVSGNIWTATGLAANPNGIWIRTNPDALFGLEYTRLITKADDATVDATPESFHNTIGSDIRINVPNGINPNNVELRKTGVGSRFYDSSAPYVYISNIRARFWGGAGYRPVGIAFTFNIIESSYNVDDGFDANGNNWKGIKLIANCNGFGNSAVDGLSSHGGNFGELDWLEACENSGGGLRNEQYASVKLNGGYIKNNRQDVIVLSLTSGGAAPKTYTITNVSVYVGPRSLSGHAVEIETGVVSGVTVNVSGCYFYNNKAGNNVVAIKANGGTLAQNDNYQSGFTAMTG